MIKTIEMNSKGFSILIIGGVHGNEVGTTKLAFELLNYYEKLTNYPENIKQITFITNANRTGIRANTRDMQYTANLNDMWSTDNNIMEDIKSYIEKSDVIIDLHCSPYIHNTFLLEVTDTKSLIIEKFLKNNFKKEIENKEFYYMVRSTQINSIKSCVNKYPNKFGFTWEQMGMDRNSYNNTDSKKFLIKFISKLPKLFNKRTYKNNNNEIMDNPCTIITTSCEGYLHYYKKLGDIVERDEVIADIRDLNTNEVITIISSPINGRFVCGNVSLYVTFDTFVAIIQP